MELQPAPKGGDSGQWFCLAMAHWRLGDEDEARRWYGIAVSWMDAKAPKDEFLIRCRGEAAALLGVSDAKQPDLSNSPSTADSETAEK